MDAIEAESFASQTIRTRWISLLSTTTVAARAKRDQSAANAALDEAVLALANAPVRTREDMRVLARAVRHIEADGLMVGKNAFHALLDALLDATINGP